MDELEARIEQLERRVDGLLMTLAVIGGSLSTLAPLGPLLDDAAVQPEH